MEILVIYDYFLDLANFICKSQSPPPVGPSPPFSLIEPASID
jgi:hypothetical protein